MKKKTQNNNEVCNFKQQILRINLTEDQLGIYWSGIGFNITFIDLP